MAQAICTQLECITNGTGIEAQAVSTGATMLFVGRWIDTGFVAKQLSCAACVGHRFGVT